MKIATVLLLAVAGCTFCYSSSKFELECHDRGGKVRTLDSTQLCVTEDGVAVSTGIVEDDAGD